MVALLRPRVLVISIVAFVQRATAKMHSLGLCFGGECIAGASYGFAGWSNVAVALLSARLASCWFLRNNDMMSVEDMEDGLQGKVKRERISCCGDWETSSKL